MDKERVGIIIRNIRDYFEKLDEVKIKTPDDLDDFKFDVVSMRIFYILNKTIDLAEEVVVSKNFGLPRSYREIFTILKDKKVINKKQDLELAELIFLRNKISHRYEGIDKKTLFNAKNDLKIVKDFIKIVILEVNKNEK